MWSFEVRMRKHSLWPLDFLIFVKVCEIDIFLYLHFMEAI